MNWPSTKGRRSHHSHIKPSVVLLHDESLIASILLLHTSCLKAMKSPAYFLAATTVAFSATVFAFPAFYKRAAYTTRVAQCLVT
jgi:hypothetical protein